LFGMIVLKNYTNNHWNLHQYSECTLSLRWNEPFIPNVPLFF
jgi:hypothetical protein